MRNGHLAVTQWLYIWFTWSEYILSRWDCISRIAVHTEHDYAFKWACGNGHLTLVQWLYDLGIINIHVENDHAFRRACSEGYLSVAQWLYSLGGVNIADNEDDAFRWTCGTGHLLVAQWAIYFYRILLLIINSIINYYL